MLGEGSEVSSPIPDGLLLGGGEECVLVELSAKVEQGLAEGLFVCDLERR